MRGYFLLLNFFQPLFMRLQVILQGMRTIDEYKEEFYNFIAMNDLLQIEDQLV